MCHNIVLAKTNLGPRLSVDSGDRSPLKITKLLLFLTLGICTVFGPVNAATPPQLTIEGNGLATDTRPGVPLSISLTYKQAQGDGVKDANMIVDSSGSHVIVPARKAGDDPVTGIELSFNFTPQNSETYKYHFEVTSTTGAFVRFPVDPSHDLQFTSVSPWIKWATLAAGCLFAWLLLPWVVYMAARSMNRRGDPSTAARIALLVGILASYALFLYLFFNVYGMLGTSMGAVVLVMLLIALFSRRPAAHQ